jgi:protein-tyrosine phosphatase
VNSIDGRGDRSFNDRRDRELYVRPLRWVPDYAVIRKIGDRDLYLGNRHAADPERHDREFAQVLSLNSDGGPLTTHHRPLIDGPANDSVDFAAAADCARRLHRQPGSTLVHCTAGISRSSAVTAAAIAVAEDQSFVDALHAVQDARPYAVSHPELHRQAVVYVQSRR